MPTQICCKSFASYFLPLDSDSVVGTNTGNICKAQWDWKEELMNSNRGMFERLSKYAKYCMPVFLLLYPIMAVYGEINPWTPADQVLGSYVGQKPLMVGFSYKAHYSSGGDSTSKSRSYILFPNVITQPRIVTVLQVNEAAPIVSESESAFLMYVAWFAICLLGTWFYWFRSKSTNTP
jgi:hypothetical protein